MKVNNTIKASKSKEKLAKEEKTSGEIKPRYKEMHDREFYASALPIEYRQSVETGFDTDCNGATVGSLVGMAQGIGAVPDDWKAPMNDTLCTTILGVGRVKISERARQTLEHIENSK